MALKGINLGEAVGKGVKFLSNVFSGGNGSSKAPVSQPVREVPQNGLGRSEDCVIDPR